MQTIFRGAGIYIPLFSLRSEEDLGVGDFFDLKLLVDFAEKAALKIIQILPINDTSITFSWRDSYPYSLLSAFALHPLYLRLEALGNLSNSVVKEIEKVKKELSFGPVDYERVIDLKLKMARTIFNDSQELFKTDPFHDFMKLHESWLKPYAVFCALRDRYKTCDTTLWQEGGEYSEELIISLTNEKNPLYKDVTFYYFLEFHLYKQLLEALDYAEEKGIFLKGDFPVGVNRQSVEVWQNPEIFRSSHSLGAPPDYYSEQGQNWNFPAYNFTKLKETHYKWFCDRLKHLSKSFSIMRIDHILGYFRFWEIGKECKGGILGHFNPAIPISKEELEKRGIENPDRFIFPLITDQMVHEKMKEGAHSFIENFLYPLPTGNYNLKEEYNTEKKIESSKISDDYIKKFLLELVENVILLPSDQKDHYHPRIGFQKTLYYRELKDFEKKHLEMICEDYFYRRQENLWSEHALEALTFFKEASSMILCAEDLGFVPDCLPHVLKELSLPVLYIQRMPKKRGEEFANTEDYEVMSVCSPSNHDTSTLREWWEEDKERSQRFFNTILKEPGKAPSRCEPWISEKIICQHLDSKSTWALFLIQDLLSIDAEIPRLSPKEERINDPFNPHHYWRYRMPLTLEDLIQNESFTRKIYTLIKNSHR